MVFLRVYYVPKDFIWPLSCLLGYRVKSVIYIPRICKKVNKNHSIVRSDFYFLFFLYIHKINNKIFSG